MNFKELQLHPDLYKGIEEAGFVSCMPVQEQVFPHAFEGEDIYAQSQTGTGKTAAFLVSIFQRIMTNPESRTGKALILAPTRELAVQILEETERIGKYLPVSAGAFFGGVGYGPQIDLLKSGVQIIIGTPGRIIDLVQQGKMLLNEVAFLVIDEADRMFDMGFIDDLKKLLRYLSSPEKRQTYLFSATLGERVRHLAWDYMRDPQEIVIEPENVTVDLVTQEVHHVASSDKFRLLLGVLRRDKPQSAIIFCNQKYVVEEVARRLNINGISCDFIMGDLPQNKRLEIINRLKSGTLSILVATDVAARGLDVDSLDLVINYDVPLDTESYVHRIGRTARAGKAGKAVTLACEKFVYGLPAIEEYINMKIPVAPFDEALLGEDKSAGMSFARGRDRSRNVSGRRGSRDSHREPRRDGRSGQRSGRGTSTSSRQPRPVSDGATRKKSIPNQQIRRGGENSPEADLYKLPLEERMRIYKKRYGGQSERSQNAEGRTGSGNRGKRASVSAPPHGEQKKPGENRPRKQRKESRPYEARTRSAPIPAPGARKDREEAPAKKGVLGFIKKLFRK